MIAIRGEKAAGKSFFSPIDDASHYELMWQMKAQKEQTKHNLFSLIYSTLMVRYDRSIDDALEVVVNFISSLNEKPLG